MLRRLAAAVLVVLPSLAIACTSDNTACGLLRRDEIERLTGSGTGPGTPETTGDSTSCEWRGESRSLLLVVHEGDRLERYRAEARGTGVDIAGLGRDAFWHAVGFVVATDGSWTVRVQLYGAEEAAPLRPDLETLTRLALERLPE